MDKLKAIKILGLNNNNPTFDEIKEAYKIVIEDVHPEEDPETFSQIQSAYRFLRSQIFNKQNKKQNESIDSFNHEINNEDTIITEKEEITKDIKDDDLEELFDDIYENSNEFFNEKNQFAQDADTLRAFALGYIPIEEIHPDYLAYLLKNFPLLQMRYKQIAFRFKTFTQNQNTNKNTDPTTIQGLIFISSIVFLIACIPIAFFLSAFSVDGSISIMLWLFICFAISGTTTYFLYRRKKEKNKDNQRINLIKEYKEARDFIYEKVGIVPMNKKEIIIMIIVSIINLIPYFLVLKYETAFIYVAIIQALLPLAYYLFRKEIAKESCGIYSLIVVTFFQLLVSGALVSNNAWGQRFSIILFLANSAFIAFKIIKWIVVKVKREQN